MNKVLACQQSEAPVELEQASLAQRVRVLEHHEASRAAQVGHSRVLVAKAPDKLGQTSGERRRVPGSRTFLATPGPQEGNSKQESDLPELAELPVLREECTELVDGTHLELLLLVLRRKLFRSSIRQLFELLFRRRAFLVEGVEEGEGGGVELRRGGRELGEGGGGRVWMREGKPKVVEVERVVEHLLL